MTLQQRLLHPTIPGRPWLATELEEGVGAVVPVVDVDGGKRSSLLLLPGREVLEKQIHSPLDGRVTILTSLRER